MGVIAKLRALFKPEREPYTLRVDELEQWCSRISESLSKLEGIENIHFHTKEQILLRCTRIESELAWMREKSVHEKTLAFFTTMQGIITDFTEFSGGAQALMEFSRDIIVRLEKLGLAIEHSEFAQEYGYLYTTGKEVPVINPLLREIYELRGTCEKFLGAFEKSKLLYVEKLWRICQDLLQIEKEVQEKRVDCKKVVSQIRLLEEKIVFQKKELSTLQEDSRYEQVRLYRDTVERHGMMKKELEKEMKGYFDSIKGVLTHQSLQSTHRELISAYLDDPVCALRGDESLTILYVVEHAGMLFERGLVSDDQFVVNQLHKSKLMIETFRRSLKNVSSRVLEGELKDFSLRVSEREYKLAHYQEQHTKQSDILEQHKEEISEKNSKKKRLTHSLENVATIIGERVQVVC